MKNNTAQTPNNFIKTLSIIHLGLMMGPVLFGFVAYSQSVNAIQDFSNTEDVFFIIVPIVTLSGIFMGNLLFNKLLKSAIKADGLKAKLAGFQTASLIRYAFIEGPAFLGVVAFQLTENLTYLYIAGVLILFLYLLRPTKDKIERGLELRGKEKDQFNNLDQPIP
ncbi:hypothetical protein [Flagellimonas eckloniae]|uniref:Uncharacterized protein n=1 Tax=Flagellimonas eckloniae TaxID=346185 RepID=A0A0Q0XLE3_9FLAO|nr:hypothetical protein [Allomuricauda eckloniae]KQC29842.1 hypothetical protein AAY42_08065 [Allomuricauda eckloniae]